MLIRDNRAGQEAKRREDQKGNAPGVSMFEPTPDFRANNSTRPMLVSLSASLRSARGPLAIADGVAEEEEREVSATAV